MTPTEPVESNAQSSQPQADSPQLTVEGPQPASGWWQAANGWLERYAWLPALVLAVGAFVARVIVALPAALNPDEAMHVLRSSEPTMLAFYREDLAGPDPSFLHVILFPLCKWFASDFMLRLPSVLAGTLTAFIGYKWLGELFDRTTALAGMVVLGFAPALIFVSAEVRGYALLLCFSVSALYFLEAGVRRASAKLLLLFGLGQCLALVSQYSALYLVFVAGCYSLYLVLRGRVRGRALWAWLVSEGMTVGLLVFLYVTHLSKLHGGSAEASARTGFLSKAYFNPATERFLAFIWSRAVAAFGFLFTSVRPVGIVLLVVFLVGVVLLAVRGIRQNGGVPAPQGRGLGYDPKPSADSGHVPRRTPTATQEHRSRGPGSVAFLLGAPWVLAAAGGVLGLYPFAGTRHIMLLAIFAAAGIAYLVRQVVGQRPVLVLAAALALVPYWNVTRYNRAGGWLAYPSDAKRSHVLRLVDFLRQQVPKGGVIFTDLESEYVLRRYLFQGHTGTTTTAPQGFYEYQWGGFQIVTLDYWKVSAESLGNELHRMAESYGLQPGTPVYVTSCGWTSSLARFLKAIGIEYPDVHEFSARNAVMVVPVGAEVMSAELAVRVRRTQRSLHALASMLGGLQVRPVETVLWPSSCLDSIALELGGRLGRQVLSYRDFYEATTVGRRNMNLLLPAVGFWVFGTRERHANFANFMNECESYALPGLRFTLLGVGPDQLAAAYLIQPTPD